MLKRVIEVIIPIIEANIKPYHNQSEGDDGSDTIYADSGGQSASSAGSAGSDSISGGSGDDFLYADGFNANVADSETDTRKTEAELRISRVKALSNADLLGVMTYLLAKYPDTFPAMLDDALSSVSPKNNG